MGTCQNPNTVRRDHISNDLPVGLTAVREFVRVAEAKLGQLQARKEYIRSRIQALRFLTKHAEASSRNVTKSNSSSSRQVSVVNAPPQPNAEAKPQPEQFPSQDKLRRACRIALLESESPQSCAEIYQRIEKRGSLSFDGYDNVLQILAAQLTAMAANSEILSVMLNGEMRWQWKSRSDLP
jgi:hypothetical protein